VIDTHCHLLPGLDDGPRTIEESLDLARMLAQSGVHHILCTPHYSSMFPTSHDDAESRLRDVRARLAETPLGLEISLAAEVAPATAATAPPEELLRRSIGRRFLLVEVLPDSQPVPLAAVVDRAGELGLKVIFGHPERCRALQRRPGLFDEFRADGALVQVVAPSLIGRWGPEVQAAAWRLVDTGRADLIGSDSHGTARRRPHLGEAARLVTDRLGGAVLDQLTRLKPKLVLEGTPAV
jgi:protein-tyrosine phosphatase